MIAAMWIFLALLVLGVAIAAWALVRSADGASRAQSILAERGELSPDEYRERLELIGRKSSRGRTLIPLGAALIVLGLVGAVAAVGIAMGRGEMGWMTGSDMGDMMMMGGDSGRWGDEQKEGAQVREIEAADFSFSPSTIRIPVDETVNISLHNAGASFHAFTVRGLDFELRAQSEEEIAGSLRASKSGRYLAFCTVPGHERMGMTATVIVEGE